MDQRRLGSSGLAVSALGMGTMTFGAESDESEAHRMLDRYAAMGGTFIDTADVYSAGRSEEIVGTWLAGRPDRDLFVIATTGRFAMGDGPNDSGAGRRHLSRALDLYATVGSAAGRALAYFGAVLGDLHGRRSSGTARQAP